MSHAPHTPSVPFRTTLILPASIVLSLLCAVTLVTPALATDSRNGDVHVYDLKPTTAGVVDQSSWTAADLGTAGGTIATCNVRGGRRSELVVASGPEASPMVWIYSAGGQLLSSFAPYDSAMKSGVTVACGTVQGKSKRPRIVTGTMQGSGPQVKVFRSGGQLEASFFAYDEGFHGGVFVAVGNTDGKGRAEIITGAGVGGGPQVRVLRLSGSTVTPVTDFFPFASDHKGGVTVAAGDVDHDDTDEVIMGMAGFGQSWVKVYKADTAKTVLGNFKAYDDGFYGGVMLATADVDRNGSAEVIVAPRRAGGPNVRLFNAGGTSVGSGLMAYESDFTGGVALAAAARLDGDKKIELVTLPQANHLEGDADRFKYIDVNLSDQTLRAYEGGRLELEFLISSGTAKYPSPTGEFSVLNKIPIMDYRWEYGPGHPDNYNIPDVPYNLHFYSSYFIHDAYWHNNFGTPMSHGCINANLENSRAIYDWAAVGDPVSVHY